MTLTLETTYEGTKAVKIVKLQRLTSSFEEIRMEQDETFYEFYIKLKDIVNSAFNLGESIAKSKNFRKILWSLPERFHAKITIIEEVKDIAQGKGGKSRNLALKGIEEEIDDFKDEDESKDEDEEDDDDKDEDEDLTFIANEIIKLLHYRKKDKDKSPRKGKN